MYRSDPKAMAVAAGHVRCTPACFVRTMLRQWRSHWSFPTSGQYVAVRTEVSRHFGLLANAGVRAHRDSCWHAEGTGEPRTSGLGTNGTLAKYELEESQGPHRRSRSFSRSLSRIPFRGADLTLHGAAHFARAWLAWRWDCVWQFLTSRTLVMLVVPCEWKTCKKHLDMRVDGHTRTSRIEGRMPTPLRNSNIFLLFVQAAVRSGQDAFLKRLPLEVAFRIYSVQLMQPMVATFSGTANKRNTVGLCHPTRNATLCHCGQRNAARRTRSGPHASKNKLH